MSSESPCILTASELVVRYNDRLVLDSATLAIHENDRLGMVGRNGSGKSTFLRILAGQLAPDSGSINARKDLIVGYLPQEFALDETLNVLENIRAGAQHVLDLIADFESLPATSNRHDEIERRIHLYDGWGLDSRIETVMSKLGCPPPDSAIPSLSGGEKRRVALARALVSRPDLLVLDEPTNHLDTESIEWLGGFLKGYPGAFLLVTHDRYFLDEITDSIVELANGTFYSYTGNYTDYLLAKAEREAAAEVSEHKRQMFLKRELEWVRRGPSARRTKSKSRLDRYFEIAGQQKVEIDRTVDLMIPPPPPLGNRIVELANVGIELGGRELFSNLRFKFEGGQRIGITGRNGLGKTTLLRIILGELQPTEGEVRVGELTKFNYVDQARMQLNEDRTVIEEISDGTEFVVFGEERLSLRGYLKRFLFTDDRISTQVKYLSGGERSRLLLARMLKDGGNFLILDEPTNDLDLATLRVLEETLLNYPGVLLVVSHDRYFLNRICTGILAFEGDGEVNYSVGNYEYYLEKRARNIAAAAASAPSSRSAASTSGAAKQTAKPRKFSYKDKFELEGIEARILEAENEVKRLEAEFADPEFHRTRGQESAAMVERIDAAKKRVAELYRRWESLEEMRAEAERK